MKIKHVPAKRLAFFVKQIRIRGMNTAVRIDIEGVVQGVGFRPHTRT